MPNPYPVLYRLGFTPWEKNSDLGPLPALTESLPPGRALDAGCGSGKHSVMLGERGWQVTGIDSVEKPLRAARARAAAAGIDDRVRFIRADVTRLDEVLGDATVDLVLDVGCLHGLTHDQQRSFAAGVNRHTGPGAHLVVLAAMPRRGVGPSGIDETGISSLFGDSWSMLSSTPAAEAGAGPLSGASFRWYHLGR